MKPKMHKEQDKELTDILRLIQAAFSYMECRIDPPSSMHRLTVSEIRHHCGSGEVWSLGTPIIACMFLKCKDDALYIGKLAVDESHRGKGLARKMIALASERAKVHGISHLELFTRIELVENQLAFSRLGFETVAKASHPGYEKTTYLIMRKPVSC